MKWSLSRFKGNISGVQQTADEMVTEDTSNTLWHEQI